MTERLDALRLSIDPFVTALSVGYTPPGHIGHRVLPVMTVRADFAKYAIGGMEFARQVADSRRGLRAKPKKVEWTASSTTLELIEHALATDIDYKEAEAADIANIDLVAKGVNTVKGTIWTERELAVATLVNTYTNYASGFYSTPSTKWGTFTSNVSDTDPFRDIEGAAYAIATGAVGRRPNVAWCGPEVWKALKLNTFVISRMPGGTGADRNTQQVMKQRFADLIEVDEFHVGTGWYSTDGSTATQIWGDFFGMAYVDRNPNESWTPSFGHTVARSYGTVATDDGEIAVLGVAGRDESEGGPWFDEYYYGETYLPKIQMTNAGYLLISPAS